MKEYLVLSGKGGTGKTSISASFAVLAGNCVIADCDVDAADMHMLLPPISSVTEDFFCGYEPSFEHDICVACGLCVKLCRFEALKVEQGKLRHDHLVCEGCGVCVDNCPLGAGLMQKRLSGHVIKSETTHGTMIHANLQTGGENSGKLVSEVRKKAKQTAESMNKELIISDGPPGIGCPVIASLSGVDQVLLVAEPTVSGLHDLDRVYKLTRHFDIPAAICVNKHDLNPEMTQKIKDYALNSEAEWLGGVPYDRNFTRAQLKQQPVVEFSDSAAAPYIKELWRKFDALCR
jgi:MinD superfamily P-loop ATPase